MPRQGGVVCGDDADLATLGGDDALGHGLLKPRGEPKASTQSPTCDGVGVAELGVGEVVGVDLDDGEISLGIGADDLGFQVAAIVES